MNIEIIEFYPIDRDEEKNKFTGTIRIKLPDLGIHILGIWVSKHNGNFYFSMPGRKAPHHETKEIIRYPFISFEDREKNQALIAAIREQAPQFIERRLADTENPIVFPQKQSHFTKKTESQRTRENGTKTKRTASTTTLKQPQKKIIQQRTQPLVIGKSRNHSLHGVS